MILDPKLDENDNDYVVSIQLALRGIAMYRLKEGHENMDKVVTFLAKNSFSPKLEKIVRLTVPKIVTPGLFAHKLTAYV